MISKHVCNCLKVYLIPVNVVNYLNVSIKQLDSQGSPNLPPMMTLPDRLHFGTEAAQINCLHQMQSVLH
jgi:hypothetical protein